jgi:1-acyl-sn-glycerol-3-phosphate acyltransferase
VLNLLRTTLLLILKGIGRTFYTYDVRWLSGMPKGPWDDLRIIAFLNHTSLYEWLYAGAIPNHLLRRIASRGFIPVADITIRRPVYGRFLKTLAPQLVPITREPDHTWQAVIDQLDPESMVIIFPEGRMKRANGLDKHGNPMTVRGGIADLLQAIPEGQMLIAYSAGLHHVQVPGQTIPNLFRTLRMTLEFVDIEEYRAGLLERSAGGNFKRNVREDFERRRDLYCSLPPEGA